MTPHTAPEKSKKVFEYLKAVSLTKQVDHLNDVDFEQHYIPWLINRGLSYHEDAVLSANMMNERPWLSLALQFTFLINTLRARSRWSKWLKREISENVGVVAEYYGCSLRNASALIELHSTEQLTYMKTRLYKGGQV